MKITIGNLSSKVEATDEEHAWLRGYLTFEVKHFRNGKYGVDRVCLVSSIYNTFPTGLLTTVAHAAGTQGIPLELDDKRQVPCPPDLTADLSWLRDYQLEAVRIGGGIIPSPIPPGGKVCRGVFKAPTGSGKTEIAAGLTKLLPCRWLFLVHRASLMEQAAERYELRTGLKAGRVGDGVWEPGDRFTAATFQTVGRALEREGFLRTEGPAKALLNATEGLIVDEAHVLPADSFYKVAMACPAYYRFGLSATPAARDDKRTIFAVGALAPVIYEIRPEVLIAAGVIARPLIKMAPVYQESEKPTWQGVYGECIVRGKPRNHALMEMVKLAEKPCLVFVKEITHGQLLHKAMLKAGIRSNFVWGSISTELRREAVEKLIRGEHEVLICSVIFQEGVDIPELRSVVIGSGGRSVIAALQRIGRGMRISAGKSTFEVWDVADRGNKWLERHANVRMHSYASQGYETTVLPSAVGPLQ